MMKIFLSLAAFAMIATSARAQTPEILAQEFSTLGAETRARTDSQKTLPALLDASFRRPAQPATRPDALLPGKRIVSYYGNPLSRRMGILGQYPPVGPGTLPVEMMNLLEREAARWREADPSTPVQPALELVATVASSEPGRDGLYRSRMSAELIGRVIAWARTREWITILDVQTGHATTEAELERLRPYLEMNDVHLALDPEFDMPGDVVPGRQIGTTDARDINAAIRFLADIVEKGRLTPKVLIVHRFTRNMVTNAEDIRLDPRVQVVMVMDGFGAPRLKRDVYRQEIANELVQFPGIKLFYNPKNDHPLMAPRDVLMLDPKPSVVIYQ